MHLGVALVALALVVVLGRVLVMTPSAEAHADTTFTVLYSFKWGATDGAFPVGGLLRDSAGNLYGTTEYGGSSNNCSGGCGTVFKLDTTGKETVLHSFVGTPTDGQSPYAGLVRDAAGNLYGTTLSGGASDFGTVFKLDTTGTETVLHSFVGSPTDGQYTQGVLVRDSAGNLYGTTLNGGSSSNCSGGCGTVFKLDTTGTETVLHSFVGSPTDGANPFAGLLRDAAGNLYGTTAYGGNKTAYFCAFGCGTVFKVDTTGAETVLHNFIGGRADGTTPTGGLVRDAAGNFYGTTRQGGSFSKGTVFKLDTTGTETLLHSFTGHPDGWEPEVGLVRDAAGNLYGTTYKGGASVKGMVFKVDATGAETVLYSFHGGAEGWLPEAGLIQDAAGNLYGTTTQGGTYGDGTVFKLSH
jgi:uncharacterized repeat protein (TIGR03803 family)